MLKFQPNVPVKETYSYLAAFPRFSLIEKIPPYFVPTFTEGSLAIANIIKQEIQKKNAQGKPFILGLATGNSPLGVYRQLIKMHKNGQLSFKNVVTFNLDEYFPILKTDTESYNFYMNEHLFRHIDIPKENTNVPDGQISRSDVTKFCCDYEQKIESYGGIDIQILGIGRTGHIGFNQPPSPINSITRLVYLNKLTRIDAKKDFGGYENVPKCAISMGIQTIKKAKKIIIMAWSQGKAKIVKKTLEGEVDNKVPSTFLHGHADIHFFIDKAAGELLTRFNTPWIIKGDIEDPIVPKSHFWVAKSVIWLSQQVKKPLLRLAYDDYQENNLSQLIMECANGNVQDLNLYVFKKILNRISGWPLGGKPEDIQETYLTSIHKKALRRQKVLVFSPHPDDDVISMGGTLKKLHDQGHDVHVAYMTSGANGVLDIEARKYVYFLQLFTKKFAWSKVSSGHNPFVEDFNRLIDQAQGSFESQSDEQGRKTEINLAIKEYIRNSEAKIALNTIGMKALQTVSLELPFYGTSHKKRLPIGQQDYQVIRKLLRELQPTAIYAAGDLTDPHGTHRKCLQIIMHVYGQQQQKTQKDPTYKSLFPSAQNFFLYRGAWEEWQISMSRKIVPMSPKDVFFKTAAILKHQSQKDGAKYMGEDDREFWVRAKQRNRETAEKLTSLGFSNYEACECFVNLNDLRNYDQL